LERALALWHRVPDAAELTGLELPGLCAWTAELASHVGAASRAVELARRAIELAGADDLHRTALLYVSLGEYLYETGSNDSALAALERAVEIVPAEPASLERAYALGSLAGGLMMARRYTESLPISQQALALARQLGAAEAEVRALTVLGVDLARLSRGDEGVAHVRHAVQLAEEIDDHLGLERAYVNLTDVLTTLGRPRESARLGQAGLEVIRRYGIYSALLAANQIEALLAIGNWDEADRLSAAALRSITSSFPHWLLTIRAAVEIGRGELHAARAPRGREGHPVRGPRVRPLRGLSRRTRPLGAPLGQRGRCYPGRSDAGAPDRSGVDPRPDVRHGAARAGGARGARTCPPGRRRRTQLAHPGTEAHRRRSRRGRGGLSGHAERRGMARLGRG